MGADDVVEVMTVMLRRLIGSGMLGLLLAFVLVGLVSPSPAVAFSSSIGFDR